MLQPLIGNQIHEEWMGQTYLTLKDLWPQNLRCTVVGINPSPPSVQRGHYYQGPVGRRQMGRLCAVGLFPFPDNGDSFDDVAVAHGVGFTDIVKRPSVGEKDLRPDELAHGTPRLFAKLEAADVPLIVCVFRHPVKALLGSFGEPGFQNTQTPWGAQVFRMPSPYAPVDQADLVMAQLKEFLANQQ